MADSQFSKALRCNIDVSMSHTVFRERHGFSSAIHPRDASVEQDGSLDTYLAKQLSEKDTSRGRSGISFSLATDAGRSHQLLQVLGDRVPSRNWSVLASAYTFGMECCSGPGPMLLRVPSKAQLALTI